MSKTKKVRATGGGMVHAGSAGIFPGHDENAGVDRVVRAWERGLRKAHGRTRAALGFLGGAAIIAICGSLLCINSPPARAEVQRLSSHALSATVTALTPSLAHRMTEPLPRAPQSNVSAPAAQ